MVRDVRCYEFVGEQLYFYVFYNSLLGLGLVPQFLVLIILLVVYWVIDARDGHPVVHACLIDASGQRVLWHVQVSSLDECHSSLIVLLAGVAKQLPYFLLAARSGLPELLAPLLELVHRERRLV